MSDRAPRPGEAARRDRPPPGEAPRPDRATRPADAADPAPDFTLMGVVNVTPDSFSDGGRFLDPGAAVAQGLRLAGEGAAILDIGGESTRPGAAPVSAADELARVLPVIKGLTDAGTPAQISIDTSKAEVARVALDAGATMVNDVTALRDPEMAGVVAQAGADLCLMHMLGDPRTMQADPNTTTSLPRSRRSWPSAYRTPWPTASRRERIMLDPGIGFGKTVDPQPGAVARLRELVELGRPVVIGTSRKSFLGRLTGRPVDDRVAATIATCVMAYERGASVFRVHDVAPVGATRCG